jgi:hypothetical protein
MDTQLGPDAQQDEIAVSLANVVAAANKQARALNVDVQQSLMSITQSADNGGRWRINYGPKNYIGRRGGDVLIEVDGNARITQVLRGQ